MGCIGDSQGALFGQCAFEKGMAKNTYGTAANLDVNIGDSFILSRHNLQTTIAWGLDGRLTYTLEGGVYVAGAIIQWLRDRMGLVKDGAEANDISLQLEDAGGVYFVPAFVGLGAPHWDSYARGTIIGLSNATSKEQIVRAGMEAIAYQVNDVLKAAELDTGERVLSLRADGGVCQSDFLLQFQADISDTEVIRPSVVDTTALGAAFMAGLGCGFWSGTAEIKKLWQADRAFKPAMTEADRKASLQGWQKAVGRSLSWIEKG
jgi:glycerol kinase